jgi:hypothetical protein
MAGCLTPRFASVSEPAARRKERDREGASGVASKHLTFQMNFSIAFASDASGHLSNPAVAWYPTGLVSSSNVKRLDATPPPDDAAGNLLKRQAVYGGVNDSVNVHPWNYDPLNRPVEWENTGGGDTALCAELVSVRQGGPGNGDLAGSRGEQGRVVPL